MLLRRLVFSLGGLVLQTVSAPSPALMVSDTVSQAPPTSLPQIPLQQLATELQVGDVVFTRHWARPLRRVADATGSWTNHVGVVIDVSGDEPLIGESKVPWSRTSRLSAFILRSEAGRVAVARLGSALTPDQVQAVRRAAEQRRGVLYDTGFNLHSPRQFCSRYVREVMLEATGQALGDVETLSDLLARAPDTDLGFWRLWYFKGIPWDRETVTPASLLRSPLLHTVFEGSVTRPPRLWG